MVQYSHSLLSYVNHSVKGSARMNTLFVCLMMTEYGSDMDEWFSKIGMCRQMS